MQTKILQVSVDKVQDLFNSVNPNGKKTDPDHAIKMAKLIRAIRAEKVTSTSATHCLPD